MAKMANCYKGCKTTMRFDLFSSDCSILCGNFSLSLVFAVTPNAKISE